MKRRVTLTRLAARLSAAAIVSAVIAQPSSARAEPQWNLGVTSTVCGLGTSDELWNETAWCNGIRGDVLLYRNRNTDFALGPYLDVSTANFADVRVGGGASLLLPTFGGDFPIVLSVGPYTRDFEGVGIDTRLFWGLRSYNFHGSYGMAGGIVLGMQRGFDPIDETVLQAGVQIDALWIALPFIFTYELIRGPD